MEEVTAAPGVEAQVEGGAEGDAARFHVGGRGGLAYVLATAIVNVLNLAFHVVISRQLGPADYGAAAALLNVVTVVSIPLVALQAAVVQAVAAAGQSSLALRRALATTLAVGALLTALLLAFSPLLEGFLVLGSIVPVLVLAAWLLPSISSPVLAGTLLGRARATAFAVAVIGGGVLRLVSTIAIDAVDKGVAAPIIGTVAGAAFTFLALFVAARPGVVRRTEGVGLPVAEAAAWPTIVALFGYSALLGVDTVLARHTLAHRTAGEYAAAATAGSIAFFLPAAATVLAFPRFLRQKDNANARRDLVLSAGIIGGIGLAVAIVMALIPGQIARAIFGGAFAGASPELRVLGFEGALLGLVSLFTYYHLARRSPLAFLPWVGSVAAIVAIELARPTAPGLAVVMLVVAAAVTAVMGLPAIASAAPTAAAAPDGAGQGLSTSLTPAQMAEEAEVDLSVVVPFFNPGRQLLPHIRSIREVLSEIGGSSEIVAVSDGSTDGSDQELEDALPDIVLIRLPRNMGKGCALRTGFAASRGAAIAFVDGDGDIPAACLPALVDAGGTGSPHFVIGSKLHPQSQVVYPWIRRIYSTGYLLLVRALVGLDISDTQTGLKLVRRDVMRRVLPLLVEQGFALDLELLAVGRRLGYGRVVEVPVTIRERFRSSISGSAAWTMLLDTVALAWRLRVRRFYDRSDVADSAGPAPTGDLPAQPSRSTT